MLKNVQHLKQSTVRMEAGGVVIYVDPVWVDGAKAEADAIFVTHTHSDHFSLQDIKRLLKKDGTLVITADGAEAAKKDGIANILTVAPDKNYTVGGIRFRTVPAYNTNKSFHPKDRKWVGYIITADNTSYYFAGDTDILPEMESFNADVAFLPVGGFYTMNAREAIEAAALINPSIAVPIHFSDVIGTTDDAVSFVRGLDKKIKGVVLKDFLSGVSLKKQSTIRIEGGRTVYLDPLGIDGKPGDADFIFISHSHGDHFSIADIKKLAKTETVLILPGDCVKGAVGAGFKNVVSVRPNKEYEVDGLKFSTVPAYNIGKVFHRKESGWVGYILNINNTRYYFAGDTDKIPEMEGIKANVAFLPVGGTYTMTSKEAAAAANLMNPLVAVPIHYADIVGTADDAENFINSLNESIKGVLLK